MAWIDRLAAALAGNGLEARAGRLADVAHGVRRPLDRHEPVRVGSGPAFRVLLFGSGPAAGWGVEHQHEGLGGTLALALHCATGVPVVVEFLVDDHWEERDTAAALRAQGLRDYDAVVVVSAYRSALAGIALDDWRAYVDELRDVLISESGPGGTVELLSLPWEDAVHRAPEQWGGALGDRVLLLAGEAEDSVAGFRQLGLLELAPPDDAAEWVGPAFSAASYRRWGAQVVADLAHRLPAAPRGVTLARG